MLATSDVHSNLLSHDYYADAPNPGFGLSRTGSLIAAARAEAEAEGALTLLLDNGDWLQGTPLAETDVSRADLVPPAVTAFQLLQYDAVGLGNHEFNFGLDTLRRALKALPCPALCTNLSVLDPQNHLPILPRLILNRALPFAAADLPPLRIGLFSVLPPQTVMWDADHLEGRVKIDDMVSSAAAAISALREEGADVVIALAHTGFGATRWVRGMENALHPITSLPGLDAAVGGHTHLLHASVPADADGVAVPVVMPGSGGSHLGVLDLDLAYRDGAWRPAGTTAALRPVSTRTATGVVPVVPEDPGMVAALAGAHIRTRAVMAEPVGEAAVPQHSYFTFIGEDRALALTAAAQAAAIRPHLAASDFADLPLLSAVAPAKFGGRAGPHNYTDVPAGRLSRRHVADLYIYPNELRCMIVDGAQIRDWLEMSAGFFNHLSAATAPGMLAAPDRAGHNFDVIFGLDYEIDPTRAAQFNTEGQRVHTGPGRIRNLRWQGRAISPEQRFVVATNNYRSSGGGNFHMLESAALLALPPQMVREAVMAYVTGVLPRDPLAQLPYPWRFTRDLGIEAIALTGPGARPYLNELPRGLAQTAAPTDCGFLALHLNL